MRIRKKSSFWRPDSILFYGSIVLNILICITLLSSLDNKGMAMLFSSDTMYVPSIYRDLFVHHNTLAGWHLNAAPDFFPDMVLYGILRICTGSFLPAIFAYSILLLIILLGLLSVLYRQFFPEMGKYYLSTGILLMSIFIGQFLTGTHDLIYTAQILGLSFHLTAFLMALLAMILLFMFIRNGNILSLVLLFIVATIATFNSLLFIIMFTIPTFFLLILVLRKSPFRLRLLYSIGVNLISLGIGLYFYYLLCHRSSLTVMNLESKAFAFSNINASLQIFVQQHWSYISAMDPRGIADLLFLFAWLVQMTLLVKYLFVWLRKGGDTKRTLEVIYLIIFVCATTIILLMPVINGSYTGYDIIRYNIFSIYLGIFSFSYLLYKSARLLPMKRWGISTITVSLFSIVFIFTAIQIGKIDLKSGLKHYMNFYPDEVSEIDSLARKYDLRNGVSTYWHAKYISMFSRENLRVVSVFPDLNPWFHVMNQNWYYYEDGSSENRRKFDFVIMDNMLPDTVQKYLGVPLDTLYMPDQYQVLLYSGFYYSKGSHRPDVSKDKLNDQN